MCFPRLQARPTTSIDKCTVGIRKESGRKESDARRNSEQRNKHVTRCKGLLDDPHTACLRPAGAFGSH